VRFKMRIHGLAILAVVLCSTTRGGDEPSKSEEPANVNPIAIFAFQERGDEVKGMGSKVTDLMFANLVANPRIFLVDRENLNKVIEEHELNLSGIVNPAQATQVGQLTGAKILVTGSVMQVGEKLYVVAKIIGTETSRVVGESVKGNIDDDLDGLVVKLSETVANVIVQRANDLVAKPLTHVDRMAELRKKLDGVARPTISIEIPEHHLGQITSDPAAETELALICTELGFKVIDAKANQADADILIVGEGFSEFASRHGALTSVKARLEVKALDRKTGQLLAAERQTTIAVDLAEQIAAKSALQESAAKIAERLLPILAKPNR
jgi:TolB-like protein